MAIELTAGTDRTSAIVWSSDGQQLASGSRDTHLVCLLFFPWLVGGCFKNSRSFAFVVLQRIYDVRAKKPLAADCAAAHDNSKGLVPIFVPRYGVPSVGGEPLCTVGFSKSSGRRFGIFANVLSFTESLSRKRHRKTIEREIALWDQRKLSGGALARVVVDHQPGALTPFYDDGTGVLYLGGKGRLLVRRCALVILLFKSFLSFVIS